GSRVRRPRPPRRRRGPPPPPLTWHSHHAQGRRPGTRVTPRDADLALAPRPGTPTRRLHHDVRRRSGNRKSVTLAILTGPGEPAQPPTSADDPGMQHFPRHRHGPGD